MNNKILLRAPATIANVGPGYDIFAMSLAKPFDEIELTLNDSKNISIEIVGGTQNIPVDVSDNTAGLALIELQKRLKISFGVHVKIIKHITSGAGFGTTGASASAAIFGMNELLNLKLTGNELVDIARYGEVASGGSPHADNVAAAMLGGFVLVKSYNPFEVLKLEMPDFSVVLALIKKSQRSTRGFITYEIGQDKLKDQMAHCASVIHAIYSNDIEAFGKAISVDHIAEPIRGAAISNYLETKKKVIEAGAFGCNVSGGGSSVFVICRKTLQDEIASLMQKSFADNPNFVEVVKTHTSNRGVEIL